MSTAGTLATTTTPARLRYTRSKLLATAIILVGLAITLVRFFKGLGATTNLSDATPWGFWIGFDVLCGVALAAGGFTLTAIVHVFGRKEFYPILPATVLTAFLGYLLVAVGLVYDLGKPLNMWHVMIMGNPHSVMFEVAWCVILYSIVLTLEFSPNVFKRLGWHGPLGLIHKITIPLVIAGVLLSTLHQSSLGTVFLIVPGKLYPLWYSPYLPVLFFFSAFTVGFAMIIVESYISSYVFSKGLERHLILALSRFLLLALIFYLGLKFQDLFARQALGALLLPRLETWCFWLEILLLLVPALLLTRARVRANQNATFLCAASVVLGIVINRLNVSIVALYASSGSVYVPSICELLISLFLVTVGVVVFGLAVKYLDIFEATPPAATAADAHAGGKALHS